ncbi:hypothetical protein Tco_0745800 [Tanacetum coccineum]
MVLWPSEQEGNLLEDKEVRRSGCVMDSGVDIHFTSFPNKLVIVCHEKVVRISLEGDEILRVQGERTQGVAKTLLNTKVDEPKSCKTKVSYDLVIFRREHQCRLLRREAWSSFEVSVGITEEGEVVTYLRFIANFSKIVKPITSLTERNQKYEWGAEREEAFQTLKNDLCDASINRM